MKFLEAKIKSNDFHDGEREIFPLDKIINMTPYPKHNAVKILAGAGLYWTVYLDSVRVVDVSDNEFTAFLMGETK